MRGFGYLVEGCDVVLDEDSEWVRMKEPPDARRGGRKVDWKGVTAEARKHPDEWVLVPEVLHVSVAANIRRGQYLHIKPEEFVVTTRKVPGLANRVRVYVKKRDETSA